MILPARSVRTGHRVRFFVDGPTYTVVRAESTTHNGAPSVMVVAEIRVALGERASIERHDYYLSPNHSCHVIE